MQIENGDKVWCNKQGQYHRTDGPAIEWENGTKIWYVNGKCHRTDGPAVEYANGTKEWRINDQLHRTDGPAVEWADNKSKEWWVNGKQYNAIVWTVGKRSKTPKAHYVASFEEAQAMMFSSLKEHKCAWIEKVG